MHNGRAWGGACTGAFAEVSQHGFAGGLTPEGAKGGGGELSYWGGARTGAGRGGGAPAWERSQGAETALVSRGTTVPLSFSL